MKINIFLTVLLITGTVFLSGCTQSSAPVDTSGASQEGAPAADQKSGDTIKKGVISQNGGSFFLQETGSQPELIESYSVDLSEYVGQTVTVTGQYSGDTLFVGKIE